MAALRSASCFFSMPQKQTVATAMECYVSTLCCLLELTRLYHGQADPRRCAAEDHVQISNLPDLQTQPDPSG